MAKTTKRKRRPKNEFKNTLVFSSNKQKYMGKTTPKVFEMPETVPIIDLNPKTPTKEYICQCSLGSDQTSKTMYCPKAEEWIKLAFKNQKRPFDYA